MKNETVKIEYVNGCGKRENGYTTTSELKEAEQGAKAFVWFTDDKNDIKGEKVVYGWTLDYLDIVKVFDAE